MTSLTELIVLSMNLDDDEDDVLFIYRCLNIDKRDLLTFSFQDFNECQAMHRKELDYLER